MVVAAQPPRRVRRLAARRVLELAAAARVDLTTKAVALRLGVPTGTARRTLEDLAAHGILVRHTDDGEVADLWRMPAWAREEHAAATVPEMSEHPLSNTPNPTLEDFSGTVRAPADEAGR